MSGMNHGASSLLLAYYICENFFASIQTKTKLDSPSMGEGAIAEFGGDRILCSTAAVGRFSTTHVNMLTYIYIYIYIYPRRRGLRRPPVRTSPRRVKIHSYIKITSAETFKADYNNKVKKVK